MPCTTPVGVLHAEPLIDVNGNAANASSGFLALHDVGAHDVASLSLEGSGKPLPGSWQKWGWLTSVDREFY